mgnify:CR=1 FL=1
MPPNLLRCSLVPLGVDCCACLIAQDPATQQRIKAMMEDPEFLSSMKQYVEQITADQQFEALKKQTESLMQEPDFVEQMTKAMMGGDMSKTLADMGATLGGAGEGEEEDK